MKTLITVLLAAVLAFSLNAQNFNEQKLDSLFSSIEQNNKGMGSLSIYKNGKEIYINSIGFAEVNSGKEATSTTKYRVGSISKTFTAAVILQLVEEGKLQLNTKLSEFYPQVPNSEKITIEDMLRHQSGIFNISKEENFEAWKGEKQTKEQHLARIAKHEPVFEPGTKSDYSNTNYILLSFIIEDIEKKDLSKVIQKRITKPLKLENTYYSGKLNPSAGEALSYRKTGEWTPIEETEMSVVKGAGAIISTPSDLNKFYTALFHGKVIKPETLKLMTTVKGDYGLGIFEMPFDGKTFYGHTGGIDGFDAVVNYLPAEDLSIAYTSNGRDIHPHQILMGVLNIYFDKAYEIPTFRTLKVTAAELGKYEGTYGSETFPLKIRIFAEGDKLMGQAAGQPSFPLEAYEKDKFKFDAAKLRLEFSPAKNEMFFKQGDKTAVLVRE